MNTLLPPIPQVYAGKKVLLTGATGFLGKVYLSSLLLHCPQVGQVVVLLRAGSQQAAQDRFLRDVIASPALDPLREVHGVKLREFMLSKCTVLKADLGQPDAGLSPAELDVATQDTDLVMHVAGLVDFVPPLDKALTANVDGTLNALELAKRAGPGRAAFVHVSTCYVCGQREGVHQEQVDPKDFPKREGSGFSGFDAEQELAVVRRLIERIKSEENEDPLVQADVWEEAGGSPRRAKRLLDVLIRRRLVEAGLERAQRWGWPNVYTYTKALAERLVAQREEGLKASALVRPAIVESAVSYPMPGWNQGVNTSAPLIWLALRGLLYWPTTPTLNLDVIPVDYVVHALAAVGAAALEGRCEPVYQLGTSDCNPFAMRRVVELSMLTFRDYPNESSSQLGKWLSARLEGVTVSKAAYEKLGAPAFSKLLRQVQTTLEEIPNPDASERPGVARLLDTVRQRVKSDARDSERAAQIMQVYLPFTAECEVTFRTDNMRRLFAQLEPADQERFHYGTEELCWRNYWTKIHIPGLERWAFPQLRLQAGLSPTELEQPFRALTELLEDRAKFGTALLWRRLGPGGEIVSRVTYKDAYERSQAAAARLIAQGVSPGSRVVLLSENCPEWGIGYFAIQFCGGTAVPLEAEIQPSRAAALARASQAKVVLLSARCQRALGDELRQALEGTGVVVASLEAITASRAKNEQLPEVPQEQELVPRAPASLIYTSGTTGAAKGVLLSHEAFCEQVRALGSLFKIGSDDRALSVLPLHHCFEFSAGFLLPLYGGAIVTFLDETTPEAIRRGLETVKPTAMIGVPALFEYWHRRIRSQVKSRAAAGTTSEQAFEALVAFHRELRRRSGVNLGRRLFPEVHAGFGGELRLVVCGGAALPRDVAIEFEGLGLDIYQGYGLTEAGPVICSQRPGEEPTPGSVGQAIPGVEVRVANPDGEGVGEIEARSPSLFLGYDGDPELTAATISEGWLKTGDLGRVDENGHLHVVGRLKDAIVDASGNTVHPDEVEDLYDGCPDVKEMAVAGVRKGEHDQVGALVVLNPTDGEGGLDEVRERVREFIRQRSETLPFAKRIGFLQFTPRALPRTPTKKVKRAEVSKILTGLAQAAERGGGRGRASGVPPSVAEVFREVGIDPVRVTLDAKLSDLGLDSISLADVALKLAESQGRELPRSLDEIETVRDLLSDAAENRRESNRPLEAPARAIPLPGLIKQGVGSLLGGLQRVGYERMLDVKVVGRGNIPHNTNCIVVANHCSHLDSGLVRHALGGYGENLVSAGARDYFFKDTLRATYFSNFTNVTAFDRHASVRESLDRFAELLRQGKTVLIFPEGTRSVSGRMSSFKPGVGMLVQSARTGVLPIYLVGTHQAMPKGVWIPDTDVRLEARIGPFLPADRLLGRTDALGRRRQALAIVNAMHDALCSLRDGTAFSLEDSLAAAGEPDERAKRRSERRKRRREAAAAESDVSSVEELENEEPAANKP